MFGLADLGYPEQGSFSLLEMTSIRLPFGMDIERDILFGTDLPISVWAEAARRGGNLRDAEHISTTPPRMAGTASEISP